MLSVLAVHIGTWPYGPSLFKFKKFQSHSERK